MVIKLNMFIRAYAIKWDNTVAMATGILTSYIPLVQRLSAGIKGSVACLLSWDRTEDQVATAK
jgi:hypothetical protein